MSTYLAERIDQAKRAAFDNYRYAIMRDGKIVAEFGHDYRNDGRWLTINGVTQDISEDLLEGGGPEQLKVSKVGSKLLDRLLHQ